MILQMTRTPMLTLTLMLMTALPVQASDVRFEIASGAVTGRGATEYFAMICSDASWKKFAPWAAKNRFPEWKNKSAARFQFTASSLKFEAPKFEVSMLSNGSMMLHHAGQRIVATDPCDLMVKYMASRPKQAWLDLAFPAAHAQLLDEDGTQDAVVTGIAVGGTYWATLGTRKKLRKFTGPAALFTLVPLGYVAAKHYLIKSAFENVLNSEFTLQCSENLVSIKSVHGTIVVHKREAGMRMELNRAPGKFDYNRVSHVSDTSSEAAPASRNFVFELAKSCNNKEDEKTYAEYLKKEELLARTRIAQVAVDPAAGAEAGAVPAAQVH